MDALATVETKRAGIVNQAIEAYARVCVLFERPAHVHRDEVTAAYHALSLCRVELHCIEDTQRDTLSALKASTRVAMSGQVLTVSEERTCEGVVAP